MRPAPPVTTMVESVMFTDWFRLLASADQTGRHTGHDSERLDVLGQHGARADDRALANGHAGKHDRVDADIGPGTDPHRANRQVSLNNRYVGRHAGVRRAEDLRPGAPADGFFDHQIAGVEIALRPDPHVIADHAAAVEATLQHCLVSYEHIRPDLEG